MSPASSFHARVPLKAARGLLAAGLIALVALAGGASVAHAAGSKITFTDPAGDASGNDGVDLVSGSVSYDGGAGSINASLVTKAAFPASGYLVLLATKSINGTCPQDTQDGSTIALIYANVAPVQSQVLWSVVGTESTGQGGTVGSSGTTLSISLSDPSLQGKTIDCINIITAVGDNPDPTAPTDSVTAFLSASSDGGQSGSSGTSGSNQSGTQQKAPVTTTLADRDKDGTPDSLDTCPTVAGASKTGCPTMPPAKEIRLGAKRVVVDKLVPITTAKVCPKLVRVRVTAKGKLKGSGLVPTSQFGGFCRVDGVVKFRKGQKSVKAVRVTMKSTGLGSIAKSAHR